MTTPGPYYNLRFCLTTTLYKFSCLNGKKEVLQFVRHVEIICTLQLRKRPEPTLKIHAYNKKVLRLTQPYQQLVTRATKQSKLMDKTETYGNKCVNLLRGVKP